jgi:hypothetical protein
MKSRTLRGETRKPDAAQKLAGSGEERIKELQNIASSRIETEISRLQPKKPRLKSQFFNRQNPQARAVARDNDLS